MRPHLMIEDNTEGRKRLESERENYEKMMENVQKFKKKEGTILRVTKLEWYFKSE